MKTEEKWVIVHNHRRMVSRGLTDPMRCSQCLTQLVPCVDEEGDPGMKCLACRAVLHLGLNDLERMKNA